MYLEFDPIGDKADRYGRTPGHVYRKSDGLRVNRALVRLGYAHPYTGIR